MLVGAGVFETLAGIPNAAKTNLNLLSLFQNFLCPGLREPRRRNCASWVATDSIRSLPGKQRSVAVAQPAGPNSKSREYHLDAVWGFGGPWLSLDAEDTPFLNTDRFLNGEKAKVSR